MLDWLRRWLGVPRKSDLEVLLDHASRSEERHVQIIAQMQATLDRIVAARYDRPQEAAAPSEPRSPLNPMDLMDVTTVDDGAFLRAVETLE